MRIVNHKHPNKILTKHELEVNKTYSSIAFTFSHAAPVIFFCIKTTEDVNYLVNMITGTAISIDNVYTDTRFEEVSATLNIGGM